MHQLGANSWNFNWKVPPPINAVIIADLITSMRARGTRRWLRFRSQINHFCPEQIQPDFYCSPHPPPLFLWVLHSIGQFGSFVIPTWININIGLHGRGRVYDHLYIHHPYMYVYVRITWQDNDKSFKLLLNFGSRLEAAPVVAAPSAILLLFARVACRKAELSWKTCISRESV